MLIQASIEQLPIPDNSIGLIFTDPRYDGDALPHYTWLAKEAKRVLKPGGFCLVMCGGYFLDKVMRRMGRYLRFHWKYELMMTDVSTVIWPRRVIARSKPILAYSKGMTTPRCNVLGAMYGGGNDKRYHHWGQDVESARYYIDTHSKLGDLVLDPFIGGGTTAVACELIGRRWIGCDIDPMALMTTQARMIEIEIPMQIGMFAGQVSA